MKCSVVQSLLTAVRCSITHFISKSVERKITASETSENGQRPVSTQLWEVMFTTCLLTRLYSQLRCFVLHYRESLWPNHFLSVQVCCIHWINTVVQCYECGGWCSQKIYYLLPSVLLGHLCWIMCPILVGHHWKISFSLPFSHLALLSSRSPVWWCSWICVLFCRLWGHSLLIFLEVQLSW